MLRMKIQTTPSCFLLGFIPKKKHGYYLLNHLLYHCTILQVSIYLNPIRIISKYEMKMKRMKIETTPSYSSPLTMNNTTKLKKWESSTWNASLFLVRINLSAENVEREKIHDPKCFSILFSIKFMRHLLLKCVKVSGVNFGFISFQT